MHREREPDLVVGPNEFVCAHCGGVFDKERTDEEAIADACERNPSFQQLEPNEICIVCEECYNLMMKVMRCLN